MRHLALLSLMLLAACGRNDATLEKEMAAYQASMDAEAAENLKAGEAFLQKTAKEPGVVTLPSGVMYKVLAASPKTDAPKPRGTDTVTVHYEGTLIDGSVFDSSYARSEPATFPLARVVPGWQIGIPQMRVGDTYMLYVPSALGYGERAMGSEIPANSTLIFKVELLGIERK